MKADHNERLTGSEALERLKMGNERFVDSRMAHPRQTKERRAALCEGQQPFAAILGCSDSRVPPEVIFDEGLGDLFVIRVAGEIVDDAVLGTIEFAADHLELPLIVVLAHARCGLIQATVAGATVPGCQSKLLWEAQNAVDQVRNDPGDLVDNAARANAKRIVAKLTGCGPVLAERVERGSLMIVQAFYDLETGRVDFSGDPP